MGHFLTLWYETTEVRFFIKSVAEEENMKQNYRCHSLSAADLGMLRRLLISSLNT